MKRGAMLALAATALVVLVGLGWLGRSLLFEKVVVEKPRSYSGEAATNPFFALRELYRGLGIEAETFERQDALPPRDHALFLALHSRPLAAEESRRIWEWVEGGGHLLVAAQSPATLTFAESLGVVTFEEWEADEDDHESRSQFDTERPAWPKLTIAEESALLRSDGESDAAWVLSVEQGEGTVTFVLDFEALSNPELPKREHARLAWWLLHPRGAETPGGAWIVYRDPPVSVWALLVSRARPLSLALALLCTVALALVSRPFGPRLEPPPRDRRHLSEHLRATGRYLWRRQVEHTLIAATQQALRERLAPGGAASRRQIRELVERAVRDPATKNLDAREAYAALGAASTQERQQFTQTIRALEELRRYA